MEDPGWPMPLRGIVSSDLCRAWASIDQGLDRGYAGLNCSPSLDASWSLQQNSLAEGTKAHP